MDHATAEELLGTTPLAEKVVRNLRKELLQGGVVQEAQASARLAEEVDLAANHTTGSPSVKQSNPQIHQRGGGRGKSGMRAVVSYSIRFKISSQGIVTPSEQLALF